MDFGAGNIAVYGLGSVAIFGVLFMLIKKFFTRSSGKKLQDIINKKAQQAEIEEDIKNLTKEQQVIAKQIKASELASEETKKKVQEKLRKAAVEIQQTLKEDSISDIDKDLDTSWGEL